VSFNPFKRKEESAEETSNWYKDQYQHMIVQRNVLAFLTLAALIASIVCVILVNRIAEVKTVEPYVVQIDDKSGIVQLVNPVSRTEYAANELIDRFFVAQYITARESYNVSILRYNYNAVRVMSTPQIFNIFSRSINPNIPTSAAALLGNDGTGIRSIRIKSVAYIQNPPIPNDKSQKTPEKIIQARVEFRDTRQNGQDVIDNFVITVTFQYANLELNEEERLINPLGFSVTQYQVQREIA
jgi:type IV secretion system protein VirB8